MKRKNRFRKSHPILKKLIILALLLAVSFTSYGRAFWSEVRQVLIASQEDTGEQSDGSRYVVSLKDIPEYSDQIWISVNDNEPSFTEEEKNADPYEKYSDLDALGRCGYAEAKLARSMMPTEEREDIDSVTPSGWRTARYDIVEYNFLYNRCHLIGFQLTGQNANEKNLITGTRYFNVEGMLPWENQVAGYIRRTGDEVMYRVTPIYDGSDLVASGVQMEAESLNSKEISFNVYIYNIQPGIGIDYSDGYSWQE